METEYINADEIAQFLRIARVTVYSLAKKGVIPQEIKIGGLRRWKCSEFQEWIKSKEDKQ